MRKESDINPMEEDSLTSMPRIFIERHLDGTSGISSIVQRHYYRTQGEQLMELEFGKELGKISGRQRKKFGGSLKEKKRLHGTLGQRHNEKLGYAPVKKKV